QLQSRASCAYGACHKQTSCRSRQARRGHPRGAARVAVDAMRLTLDFQGHRVLSLSTNGDLQHNPPPPSRPPHVRPPGSVTVENKVASFDGLVAGNGLVTWWAH